MAALVRSGIGTVGDIFGGTNSNSGTPTSLAGGNIAVTGNLIIVTVHIGNNFRSVSSITDNAGTTYVAARAGDTGGPGRVQIWYGSAAANSAGQGVYATLSGTTNDTSLISVFEVSGLASDQSSLSANGASLTATASHDSGNVTPPNAAGLLIALMGRTNGDWTDDADLTEVSTASENHYIGYIVNPAASAQSNTATSVDNEDSIHQIVAFVGVEGGGYSLAWIRA